MHYNAVAAGNFIQQIHSVILKEWKMLFIDLHL